MDYNKISKEVREQGVSSVPGFLSATNFKKVYEILGKNLSPKGGKTSHLPISSISYLIKVLKFDFLAIKKSSVLKKVAKELNLNELVNNILGKKTKLLDIDSYLSIKSSKNVLEWHCDKAYNGDLNPKTVINPNLRSIKFFIYLTNVASNNGCMSYIPKTHKIAYEIRKGIYNKEISYQPYWSLKDFRNIVKNNINFLHKKIDSEIIENFLKNSEFEDSMNASNKYDYNATAGTMIVFDEGGIHRGSKPSLNDRMIIRYLIKPSSN